MPLLLLAIFLKGPAWLRAGVLLSFFGLLLFGCFSAANTIRNATERTVPAHVHHIRTHHHALSQ